MERFDPQEQGLECLWELFEEISDLLTEKDINSTIILDENLKKPEHITGYLNENCATLIVQIPIENNVHSAKIINKIK